MALQPRKVRHRRAMNLLTRAATRRTDRQMEHVRTVLEAVKADGCSPGALHRLRAVGHVLNRCGRCVGMAFPGLE